MKSVDKINISIDDVASACRCAFQGHSKKQEVVDFNANFDSRSKEIFEWLIGGEWEDHIFYRKLSKRNKNGKLRNIDSPDLVTRIYQHLFLNKMRPIYDRSDNLNGLNCKIECGLTSKKDNKSLIKRMKHAYFDRTDLNYCLVLDQRKCYEHITPKVFRRELKRFVSDKWFIDFAVKICFVNEKLPIGTPSSPFVHHIVMADFDHFVKRLAPFSARYADDNFLAFHTKEEADAAKWRIKNYWWYRLRIRSKRHTCVIQPMDVPLDFCGYVYYRNNNGKCEHNKGHVKIRERVANDAKRCKSDKSWASYFGLLKHADTFSLMESIENKMKLTDLTSTIRIDRHMDAPNIDIRDLVGARITVHDYDIRKNSKGQANWIKCLIGKEEIMNGVSTGKIEAREFHGDYQGIIQFILKCEEKYTKEEILPLEDAEIVNQCGYIFKGSTNQIQYIE